MGNKVKELDSVNSKKSMSLYIDSFRVFASNHKSTESVMTILEEAINKSKLLDDSRSLVKLYEIKISQIEHLKERQQDIILLIRKMKAISNEINYIEGLALSYYKEWYIEKIKGNTTKSTQALKKSIDYVSKTKEIESYVHNVCMYSYAVEKWLTEHDESSSVILEKCANYFIENGFHRSLVQTTFLLVIIYSRTHKGGRILETNRRIFEDRKIFNSLTEDVKAISYHSIGFGYLLNMNLKLAESLFEKATIAFQPIYRESIYSSYFVVLCSDIITVKALQGKFEQAWKMIRKTEKLLQDQFFDKILDLRTRKQIQHTLNLNKFYVHSRLKGFKQEERHDLILEIYDGSKTLYSDFLLLSEFILNANLEPLRLKKLLKLDNFSINRVKHLLYYSLLENSKFSTLKKRIEKRIEILSNRKRNDKTNFIEDVLCDLLIAQQLHSLKRYGEISALLRKYENQLDRIQVLELSLFMEAFIQIGAYRNGDPLGPIFQYVAIKKCRYYGYSHLENKLLNYLEMQKREVLSWLK